MTTPTRLHAIIHGYVQGVGYRAFAAREARRLGLSGTARNQADGTVEVVAEGDRATLEALLDSLRRGPSEAEVTRVEVRWEPAQGTSAGFQITY